LLIIFAFGNMCAWAWRKGKQKRQIETSPIGILYFNIFIFFLCSVIITFLVLLSERPVPVRRETCPILFFNFILFGTNNDPSPIFFSRIWMVLTIKAQTHIYPEQRLLQKVFLSDSNRFRPPKFQIYPFLFYFIFKFQFNIIIIKK
jgi:hypothetical protein